MPDHRFASVFKDTSYFHGGPRGFARGMFILPAVITKAVSTSDLMGASVHRKDRVYVTTDIASALLYACVFNRGWVYEVEPFGALEDDPDCSMDGLSFQCSKARIVRIHKPSEAHLATARKALIQTEAICSPT